MTTITKLQIFADPAAMSQYAADLFARLTRTAIRERGLFQVSLSGGGTPMALYRILARESLPWDQMRFFWGDERCVPPTDAESCYHQAQSVWLAYKPVLSKHVFRIPGELGPDAAASAYAAQLADAAPGKQAWPNFDLALLGLGGDGHTASLFPGSPETQGIATVAVTAHYQDRPANRVSLTPDVFNSARNIAFLAVGKEKATALRDTLCGERTPALLPAQRIQPENGTIWWLVDEAAASLLPAEIENVSIRHFRS